MLVSISTTVVTAERCYGRSKATAAYSAPTAMYRARRFRKHARVVASHHAVAGLVPPESERGHPELGRSDWASAWRSFIIFWGLPSGFMLVATRLGPQQRTMIWTAMLFWMGVACLANARRCGRTHCRFTGPFFILMAASVPALGSGIVDLGQHGWSILSGIILIGATALGWASEHAWGRYSRR